MKKTIYFLMLLFSVVCVICASCANTNSNVAEQALTIAPLPLQAGKPMNIVYNSRHPKAKYKSDDSIYATVITRYRYFTHQTRIALESTNNGVFEGTWNIPDSALNVTVEVGPYGDAQFLENFTCPVYAGEKPVRYAIPYAILNAYSYEEGLSLFALDERVYPETYDRYLPLWQAFLRMDEPPRSFGRQVDSMYNTIYALEKCDYARLSACAAYYAKHGNMKKLSHLIKQMEGNIYHGEVVSMLSAFSWQAVWNSLVQKLLETDGVERNAIAELLDSVLHLFLELENVSVLETYMRDAEMPVGNAIVPEIRNMFTRSETYSRLVHIASEMDVDEFIRHTDYPFRLLTIVEYVNDHQGYIDIVRNIMPGLDSSLLWLRSDRMREVSSVPAYGIETSIKYNYTKHLLAVGDTANAHAIRKSMLNRKAGRFLMYAMINSARELAKYYISRNEYDSAEMYCGYSIVMNSRFADEVYDTLKSVYGQRVPMKEMLADKYYRENLVQSRKIHPLVIHGEQREYTLGKKDDDTTYLVFVSSRSCSLCKMKIPPTIEQVLGRYKKMKIIIAVDAGNESIQEEYVVPPSEAIDYAPADMEILAKLGVRNYPAFCIVHKNMILINGGVSDETHKIIANAMKRITQ